MSFAIMNISRHKTFWRIQPQLFRSLLISENCQSVLQVVDTFRMIQLWCKMFKNSETLWLWMTRNVFRKLRVYPIFQNWNEDWNFYSFLDIPSSLCIHLYNILSVLFKIHLKIVWKLYKFNIGVRHLLLCGVHLEFIYRLCNNIHWT